MKNSVNVKMIGNWKGAVKTAALLNPVIKKSIVQGQRKYARRLVAIVKKHIISQDLGWKPASASKRGSLLMIDTRDYYTSIRYWQKNYELHVGVPTHLIHGRSGKPIWKIASWQEQGNKRVPKRPLWAPSIKEMGGNKEVANQVQQEITRNLRAISNGAWEIKST